MERSFKTPLVFYRSGITALGETTVKSLPRVLDIERMLVKNIALIPCPKAVGGKTSIRDICIKQQHILPIDLELMNYMLTIPELFQYLMEKAGISPHKEITVLCNGTTLYLGEIPTYKVFLHFKPGQEKVEINTVGKNYWGKLPDMYQLVYHVPLDPTRYN